MAFQRIYTRSIWSFQRKICAVVVEFDASLSGGGVLWFRSDRGREVLWGAASFDLSLLDHGDPAFQNTNEFVVAMLGIVGAKILFLELRAVALRGDSVTALNWARSNHFRGVLVTNAALVFTMVLILFDVEVVDVTTSLALIMWLLMLCQEVDELLIYRFNVPNYVTTIYLCYACVLQGYSWPMITLSYVSGVNSYKYCPTSFCPSPHLPLPLHWFLILCIDDMFKFVASSVQPATLAAYERRWVEWVQFLAPMTDDPTLQNHSDIVREQCVISFVKWLYDQGKWGKQVTSAISAIKQWLTFHSLSTHHLETPAVKQALKASIYSQSELRSVAIRTEHTAIIPVSLDFLLRLRLTHWTMDWTDRLALDRAGVYIAAMLCYDLGARIGTFTKVDGSGKNDHCVRAEQVFFISTTGFKVKAGEDLRSAVYLKHISPSVLHLVKIHLYT